MEPPDLTKVNDAKVMSSYMPTELLHHASEM